MPAVAIRAVECDLLMGQCCGAVEQEAVVCFHERLRELRSFLADERQTGAAGAGHNTKRRRVASAPAAAADRPGKEEEASHQRRARFEVLLSGLRAAREAVVDCWVAVAQAAASRQVANGACTASGRARGKLTRPHSAIAARGKALTESAGTDSCHRRCGSAGSVVRDREGGLCGGAGCRRRRRAAG